MYNLTERQKDLLRQMVHIVKTGAGREPFLPIGRVDGYTLHPTGSQENIDMGSWGLGDLDALVDMDLLNEHPNSAGTSMLYSIKQAGYDAVDSDFNAPDTSFVTYVTPLVDTTSLDPEIKSRVLSHLPAGSADPKLWDTAVRNAGVILEERLRSVGSITDRNTTGRDLVNAVFGKSGTLAEAFPTDSEREGYRDLFAGAVGVIRNNYAHRFNDPSPEDGGALIVFFNLLLKLLGDIPAPD